MGSDVKVLPTQLEYTESLSNKTFILSMNKMRKNDLLCKQGVFIYTHSHICTERKDP